MVIYISGPMTGIPEFNYPAFIEAKTLLEKEGFSVLSPHEAPKSETWEGYMRHDLKLVCDSDAICLLPGLEEKSRSLAGKKLLRIILGWLFGFLKVRITTVSS